MCKDGDLWHLFERILLKRGKHSIKVSWCKGHATTADLQTYNMIEDNRKYNNVVNQVATEQGQQSHHPLICDISAYYQHRAKQYSALTSCIHDMFCRVILEHHKQLNAINKQDQPLHQGKQITTIKCATSLTYADFDDTAILSIAQPPPEPPTNHYDRTTYHDIWIFLSGLRLQHADGDQQCITWQELYILFLIRGGRLQCIDTATPHAVRPLLRETLRQFKHLTKQIIADCGDAAARALFAPTTSTKARFAALGAHNHQPAINALAHTHENEALDITRALVAQRVALTINRTQLLREGNLDIPVGKHINKGSCRTTSYITVTDQIQHGCELLLNRTHAQDLNQHPPTKFYITCTTCQSITIGIVNV